MGDETPEKPYEGILQDHTRVLAEHKLEPHKTTKYLTDKGFYEGGWHVLQNRIAKYCFFGAVAAIIFMIVFMPRPAKEDLVQFWLLFSAIIGLATVPCWILTGRGRLTRYGWLISGLQLLALHAIIDSLTLAMAVVPAPDILSQWLANSMLGDIAHG